MSPYQKAVVWNLYGWVHVDTGFRRYRELFLGVPRKQGKSTLLAALAIYSLGFDDELGAEVYCCAAKEDQAKIIFRIADQMISLNPSLSDLFKTTEKRIIDEGSFSYLTPLAGVPKGQLGLNASFAICDEVSAELSWSEELYDAIGSSMGSRDQPLLLMATTAGHDKSHFGYERLWRHARAVRKDPTVQLSFLPALWEPTEEQAENWQDLETFKAVNPNLGISVNESFFLGEVAKCKSQPSYERIVKKFYLNLWCDNESRWLSVDDWQRSNVDDDELPTEEELQELPCHLAFDVSTNQDLTAVALLWELPSGKFGFRVWHFLPGTSNLLKDPSTKRRFEDDFEPDPRCRLTITPRKMIDTDAIRDKISELSETYQVIGACFDPWNSLEIARHCDELGIEAVSLPPHFSKMSGPSSKFEQLVVEGSVINLDRSPLLDWQAENVSIAYGASGKDDRQIRPVKPPAGNLKKIDGIYACVLALGHWQMIAAPSFIPIYAG